MKKYIIAFCLSFSILNAQTDIKNFYSYFEHKADLTNQYIQKYLPMKGLCYKDICGFGLVNSAKGENLIKTNSYYFLVGLIHNTKLNADFYLISTFDSYTDKPIDKLFILKNIKDLSSSKTITYQTANLFIDKQNTSNFTIETTLERVQKNNKSTTPKVLAKTVKVDQYKIYPTGAFSVAKNISTVNQSNDKKSTTKASLHKLLLMKYELLARYNYDFGDVKLNRYFFERGNGYKPLVKDVKKIVFKDFDQDSFEIINEKIEEELKNNPSIQVKDIDVVAKELAEPIVIEDETEKTTPKKAIKKPVSKKKSKKKK